MIEAKDHLLSSSSNDKKETGFSDKEHTTPSSAGIRRKLVVIDYGEHHRKTLQEKRPSPLEIQAGMSSGSS